MCSLIQPLTGDFAVSKMTLTTYYQGMSTELQSARGMQRLKLLTTSSPNVCLPGNSGNKYVQRWHPNFPQSESFSRIQVHHYKYCPDLPSLVLLGTLNTPPRCRVLETATTACWELAEMRLRLNILLVRCNQVCITEEKETNNNSPPKHPQKEYQKQLNTYFRFQINEFFAVKCTRNYMWQKWSSPNNHLHLATNTENPIRYQYHDSGCLRSAENSNRQ